MWFGVNDGLVGYVVGVRGEMVFGYGHKILLIAREALRGIGSLLLF